MSVALADYLPVIGRHAVFLSRSQDSALASVACPSGAPVFAISAGIVSAVEVGFAGELVLRLSDGLLVHYRRLSVDSSVHEEGSVVTAGQYLGSVSDSNDVQAVRGLLFGLQRPDGTWLDAAESLGAALDPATIVNRVDRPRPFQPGAFDVDVAVEAEPLPNEPEVWLETLAPPGRARQPEPLLVAAGDEPEVETVEVAPPTPPERVADQESETEPEVVPEDEVDKVPEQSETAPAGQRLISRRPRPQRRPR